MNRQLVVNFQCRLEKAISLIRTAKGVKRNIFYAIMEDVQRPEMVPVLLEDAEISFGDRGELKVLLGIRHYRFNQTGELFFLGTYVGKARRTRNRLGPSKLKNSNLDPQD